MVLAGVVSQLVIMREVALGCSWFCGRVIVNIESNANFSRMNVQKGSIVRDFGFSQSAKLFLLFGCSVRFGSGGTVYHNPAGRGAALVYCHAGWHRCCCFFLKFGLLLLKLF